VSRLTEKTDESLTTSTTLECLHLAHQTGVVEFSIGYINHRIRWYEMRDAKFIMLTAYVLRVRSLVCRTGTAACRTTSNRRRMLKNPDLRRFLPRLTLVVWNMHTGWYVSY
jgi:hypothetical protein